MYNQYIILIHLFLGQFNIIDSVGNEIRNKTLCSEPKATSSSCDNSQQQSCEFENLVQDNTNRNSDAGKIAELMNAVQNIGHVMMKGKFKS